MPCWAGAVLLGRCWGSPAKMEPSCSAVYKAIPVYTGAHPVLAGLGAQVRAQPVASRSPERLSFSGWGAIGLGDPPCPMPGKALSSRWSENGVRPGPTAKLLPLGALEKEGLLRPMASVSVLSGSELATTKMAGPVPQPPFFLVPRVWEQISALSATSLQAALRIKGNYVYAKTCKALVTMTE